MNHIVTPEYLREQGLSETAPERFWNKVNKDGPIPQHCPELGCCWGWLGALGRDGRSVLWASSILNRNVYAARVAWTLCVGPIPEGNKVLHHCDNPTCVRPEHLFLGTAKDNVQDMISKGRNAPTVAAVKQSNHRRRGEFSAVAKFSWDDIKTIRDSYSRGETIRSLSNKFSVTYQSIHGIVRGNTWLLP